MALRALQCELLQPKLANFSGMPAFHCTVDFRLPRNFGRMDGWMDVFLFNFQSTRVPSPSGLSHFLEPVVSAIFSILEIFLRQENGSKSTALGELPASRVRLFDAPCLERGGWVTASGRRRAALRTGAAPSSPARLSEFHHFIRICFLALMDL